MEPDPADRLISNLLSDLITAKVPPDLTQRIQVRLQTGLHDESHLATRTKPFQDSDYEFAIASAEHDLKNGYGSPKSSARKVPIAGSVDSLAHGQGFTGQGVPGNWVVKFVLVISGLAAVLVLGLLVSVAFWQSNGGNSSELSNQSNADNIAATGSDSQNQTVPNNAKSIVEHTSIEKTPSPEIRATVPPLENDEGKNRIAVSADREENGTSPTASVESTSVVSNDPSANLKSSNPTANFKSNASTRTMSDKEMVGILDNQFVHLWKRLNLTAMQNIKDDEWLDRTSVAIVGRVPTAAERESFRSSKRDDRSLEYVNKLLVSGEFASHWADLLAEHYLGYRVVGVRRQSTAQRQFVRWLADELSKRSFIGQMEFDMLGDSSIERSTERTDVSSFWIAETLDRSNVEYQESGSDLLKTSTVAKHASRIGMSRQLMRVSGNATMVCSQCHTLNVSGNESLNYLSIEKSATADAGMPAFWQVPASISGWTFARKDQNERSLTQAPASDFFFEDADGRLKVAAAGLPTWNRPDTPKLSLSEWMKSAMDPRRMHVDLVWRKVFGQPLVPVFGLVNEEGLDERIDLRNLLADQLQLGQRDLGSMLRWFVLSKPFRVDGQTLDTPWYLRSSEIQMAESQRYMRMFASSSIPKLAVQGYADLSMNRVSSLVESKRVLDSTTQALAQRADSPASTNKGSNPSKPNYTEDQIRFLNAVSHPYENVNRLAQRLTSNPMKWSHLVDHAFLVSDSRFPTKLEREEANKLFEAAGRDRTKALLALIQARLGTY